MRIAVLGLGLIGGSAALALAEAGHDVVGFDTDGATREAAAGHFTVAAEPDELRDSDIAVVAVPLRLTARIAQGVFAPGAYGGLITDVASVKSPILWHFSGHPRFVGGHPMAGKETAGFASAESGLFAGRKWVLCLEEGTNLRDWIELARLWTSIGARVVPATAADHDAAVAKTSHIEHLVAAALAERALGDPLAASLAAGSFRDATRVALSPPELVAGMVDGNADAIATELSMLAGRLEHEVTSINTGRAGSVVDRFDAARRRRAAWPAEPGEVEIISITERNLLLLGSNGGWVESILDNEVATVRRPRVQSTHEENR